MLDIFSHSSFESLALKLSEFSSRVLSKAIWCGACEESLVIDVFSMSISKQKSNHSYSLSKLISYYRKD